MPQDAARASPDAPATGAEALAKTQASPKVPERTGYAVAAGVALLLTFTGAFETASVPLLRRLVYWLVVMLSGSLIGSAVTLAIKRWGRLAAHAWFEGAVIACAIALPLTLLVMGASMVAFGLRAYSSWAVVSMFALVLMISALMVAVNYLLAAQMRAGMAAQMHAEAITQAAAATTTGLAGQRFRDRLPLPLQTAQLLAVASEDHYIRVYCDTGEAMILLRLADAIAELADVPGAQTHRSWWVARDAVVRAERGAGKAVLHLADGTSAPVSRSFLPVLAQQGWA